jgi:hypothetical protein
MRVGKDMNMRVEAPERRAVAEGSMEGAAMGPWVGMQEGYTKVVFELGADIGCLPCCRFVDSVHILAAE